MIHPQILMLEKAASILKPLEQRIVLPVAQRLRCTWINSQRIYAPAHLSPESKNSGREALLLQRLERLAG
jgi:hypothetical protein